MRKGTKQTRLHSYNDSFKTSQCYIYTFPCSSVWVISEGKCWGLTIHWGWHVRHITTLKDSDSFCYKPSSRPPISNLPGDRVFYNDQRCSALTALSYPTWEALRPTHLELNSPIVRSAHHGLCLILSLFVIIAECPICGSSSDVHMIHHYNIFKSSWCIFSSAFATFSSFHAKSCQYLFKRLSNAEFTYTNKCFISNIFRLTAQKILVSMANIGEKVE